MSDGEQKAFSMGALAILALAALGVGVAVAFMRTGDTAGRDPFGEATTRAHPGAGKKLVFLVPTSHKRAGEMAAKAFEKEAGTVFQLKVVNYEELGATVERDHASNAPQIDVFMAYYYDLVSFAARGAAMDLTDYIEQNKNIVQPSDFLPGLYDPYTLYKGRRWALPFDADTHVLFYRKSLLAKHRLNPPETWDEYLDISRTITERERAKGIYGAAIMANRTPGLIISSFMNRLATFGGNLVDDEGRPTVNAPEAVQALSAMIEHAKYALPTPLETDFDVSRLAFLSGKVAMVEQWTDIGVMAEDPTQSTISRDWGVVPMPKGQGPKARRASALNAGFSLAAASTTKEPDIARAFVRFATRPDTLLSLNLVVGGMDPARLSVLNSAEFRKFAPEVSAIQQVALTQPLIAWPRVPQTRTMMDVLGAKLAQAMELQLSPQQALDAVQTEWLRILADAGSTP